MKWIARFAVLLGVLSCLIVVLAGPAYRFGVVGLELALLTGFKLAVYTGLGAIVLGVVAVGARLFGKTGMAGMGILAIVAGLAGAAVPVAMRSQAERVPAIHDITTDINDPPTFVAIAPLRADAPNPAAYDPGVAAQQQEAYPDLQPIRVREPVDAALRAAEAAARSLGWELVAVVSGEGRLEATDTTRWFGFKDDIVVRIRDLGGVTVVDARSKSRVGRSDLGKNAERLRAFRHALLSDLTTG